MCTPAKRPAVGVDVLDLSRKSSSPCPVEINSTSQDIIVLSEDDEDKTTPVTSDTEKENDPFKKNGADGKSLLIYLENELRQEETALLLLQKLRERQKSNSTTPTFTASKTTLPVSSSPVSQQINGHINSQSAGSPAQPTSRSTSQPQLPKNVPIQLSQSNSPVSAPKVTKAAALQSLEQSFNAKKTVLRKQLERNLDKVTLPRPTTGTGLCEVSFIPSALTAEFTSLLGLEEVVRTIQDFDPFAQGKQSEPRRSFDPFVCVKCSTDFTPVWKREKPGSTSVICESCLAITQRSSLQKEYEESVQQVLQQYVVSERDVEREYQDMVTNPTKLDAYIKEQEKKLLAAHQAQLAQQQQIAQQQAAVQQARYNNKQSGVNNVRTHQTTTIPTSATHQRSRTGVATPTQSGATQSSVATAAVTSATSTQQLAQQYQQLAKAAAAAGGTTGAGVNPAAFMMAAAANTQQQQQQQRLAAAVISGLQQQQQAQQFQSSPDQFAQAVIMNNLCGGGASNPTANTRLLQQAMQYILLLQQQQQQQQAVAAQQQAAAAAAAQAQQNAVLSQIFSSVQSNPTAYLSLLQQVWGGASAAAATSNNANTQNNTAAKK